MYVTHLSLTSFRSYTRLEIDLPARVNVLQGENAQGKTNLLEAIYYLATTKSPLASSDRQLVHWAADKDVIPHAHLRADYIRGGEEHTIESTLIKEQRRNSDAGTLSFRRQIRVDGVPRRALDAVGKLNVVLFLPQDIDVVSGSPSTRRRYLDVTLCQIDPLYCRSLSRYNRIISQRNALLRHLRERLASASELDYWDEQLAESGAYVLSRRFWATRELDAAAKQLQEALTGGQERLALVYQSSLEPHLRLAPEELADADTGSGGNGDPADVSHLEEAFLTGLKAARSEEIARAVTIIGPHRDDLRFLVNGVDATVFGSRGQQRTIAVAVKLGEVAVMQQEIGETPVLLLDDVISELDQRRGRFLLEAISAAQQVLITTTDLNYYTGEFLDSAVLWRVAGGAVTPLEGPGQVPA